MVRSKITFFFFIFFLVFVTLVVPKENQYASQDAYAENMEDANLFLPHQCLLVDHETQSGRWWSVCQRQRPDKDGPLYKSLRRWCCGVNLGFFGGGFWCGFFFYFWVNLGEKQFVNCSSAFQPHQVWSGVDWQLHQGVLQCSVEPVVDMEWLDR